MIQRVRLALPVQPSGRVQPRTGIAEARACGGPLVNRSPRPPGTGILTPLGEQLCQQARDYLQPPAPGPDAPPPASRARSRRATPGSR